MDNIRDILNRSEVNDHTELFAFFADPAAHSLSPKIYNSAFQKLGINGYYEAFQVEEGMIGEAVAIARDIGIKGFNISMPHKQKVMEYLDVIDETAGICNAVNTVTNVDGKLTGYNTDVNGVIGALGEIGANPKSANVVLLGLGGAGKAALTALAIGGAAHVSVFVRSNREKEHIQFAKTVSDRFIGISIRVCNLDNKELLKERLDDSNILINCTCVGMGNYEGDSLIPDASYIHHDLYVLDAIYAPRQTKLLKQAKAAGCKRYANGLSMLIHQGAEAFKLYTGQEMPISIIENILK